MPEKLSVPPSTVYVIPHTHWDREWYAPFQKFRVRLVHVLDDLLALLERDPSYTHFNLDAQTIVLQDYLEIRPERRAQLQKFIRERRLGVGPWYVLPDEFLVSGEALIRNLLLGHRLAAEFGHVQKVGYIPDTFGHISQLPQILQGFGIQTAMHFRGLDEGNLKSEVWWQSPDGSRVLLRHLPTDMGYSNASALGKDIQTAASDLQILARYETRRAASSVLLALAGVDHLPAREDLPAVLEAANHLAAGRFRFRQSSLEEYFAALQAALGDSPLQTVSGELRDANRTSGQDNRLLPHVLSSRIYNKLQNEHTQTLLERWAEPWSAILWSQGEDYPQAFLWRSWQWLLENHPHDSIGGCGVDAVHAQMETRFAWALEIADEILGERFAQMANQIDLSSLKENEAALIVFNGLPWAVEGGISVAIDLWDSFLDQVALNRWTPPGLEDEPTAETDAPSLYRRRIHQQWYEDQPILPSPRFKGVGIRPLESDQPLPVQLEATSRTTVLRPLVSGPSSERRATRLEVSFSTKVPAYGYRAYAVTPLAKPNKPVAVTLPPLVLENEFLQVQIAPNGTLTIGDKTTGAVYRDLGYLEDGGDCGDGYNYSYPPQDRVEYSLGSSPRISRVSSGPVVQRYRIDYDWSLPEGLDDRRQKRSERRQLLPVSLLVSLTQGVPRADLQITVDNRLRDHRLRILFPSDIAATVSSAAAQFDVVDHPIHVEPVPEEAWVEDAPTTFPQQGWVDLSDGRRGLCIISQGLPEYETLPSARHEIAITLMRAVGYLGAGTDLQTAACGAGPNIATPEAQIQRKLIFSLSVYPHAGTWDQAEVWRHALAHSNPPRAITTGMAKGDKPFRQGARPAAQSFCSIDGKNIQLSSLKKAEDGQALIVRLYNPSKAVEQAVLRPPFLPARLQWVGLDEQPQADPPEGELPVLGADGQVLVSVPPGKIVTLRIERK